MAQFNELFASVFGDLSVSQREKRDMLLDHYKEIANQKANDAKHENEIALKIVESNPECVLIDKELEIYNKQLDEVEKQYKALEEKIRLTMKRRVEFIKQHIPSQKRAPRRVVDVDEKIANVLRLYKLDRE